MKQIPTELCPSKNFRSSERTGQSTAPTFLYSHKSRMLCDTSISNIQPPIFLNYKPTHYQVPGVTKRDISRAICSTKAKMSHGTEVLSWIFSKGNAMMINNFREAPSCRGWGWVGQRQCNLSPRSRHCQHILIFVNISFFAEIYYFLWKTRLLSNLPRTPCTKQCKTKQRK